MNEDSNQFVTCTNCNANIPSGKKFCIECGKPEANNNINSNEPNLKPCPNCNAKISSEKKFCTNCGESFEVKTESNNPILKNSVNVDDTIDSLKSSGKGLMKGMGGFLDKAATSIDSSINGNKSTKRDIDEIFKQKDKIESNSGYLVCDVCGGYYELQPNEKPDDFSDECECGGTLFHQASLPA
ncbi:zinc ribbon domain-containing protein [Methanobacterium sp.]|uniref:zinc ribbon domain-containing protein n=1 Tax=Methanobacterium sp. TaxID=2164 RepID=UPI002ABC816C|nr:zinc ribbon domain-containing protein [Methanobacterium sp.]MDY9924319.1 zinc ribbon domain-containing protein [Methanobacterium sp.]